MPGAFTQYIRGLGIQRIADNDEAYAQAGRLFKRAINLDENYADAYLAQAEILLARSANDKNSIWLNEAETRVEQALRLNPDLAEARYLLGRVYQQQDRFEPAVRAFLRTLEKNPRHYDAGLALAACYREMKNNLQAEGTYQAAIRIHPRYPEAHKQLGLFYYRKGRIPEAIARFEVLTRLIPQHAWGFEVMLGLYGIAGNIEKARANFDRVIELKPSAFAYSNMGSTYFLQRRYEDARTMLSTAVQMGSKDWRIWGNLADCYRYLPGYETKADKVYAQAIELARAQLANDPQNDAIRSSLALYLAKTGQREMALRHISDALDHQTDDLEVLRKGLMVYELCGQRERALVLFRSFLDRQGPTEQILDNPDLKSFLKDKGVRNALKESALGIPNRIKNDK